jgi:hypothetical protein
VEVVAAVSGDLLGEFDCHVVGVVGGLDDAANHELGSDSGQHNEIIYLVKGMIIINTNSSWATHVHPDISIPFACSRYSWFSSILMRLCCPPTSSTR